MRHPALHMQHRTDGPLHAEAEIVLFRLRHEAGGDIIRVPCTDEMLDAEHHSFFITDQAQADPP